MNRKRTDDQRREWGLVGLILASLLLALVSSFFRNAEGLRHGWSIGFLWMLATFVTFVYGLIYFAQFVSPLRGEAGWFEGLKLLYRSTVYTTDQFLNRLFPPPQDTKKKRTRPVEMSLPPSLRVLKAGFVKGHQVLALTKGNSYARPAGPGFVVLYRGERVHRVIDLRTQRRSISVSTKTRDGIPVKTSVSVTFRIKRAPVEAIDPDVLFPYDREAIFHVSFTESVDDKGNPQPWTEQLAPPAAGILARELPHYPLNELTQPSSAVSPLDSIKQTILQHLRRQFEPKGIEVMGVGIGPPELPDEVREQHVRTWQADWLGKIRAESAVGDAEAARRIKQARARAQIEIIENITQSIEAMRQEGTINLSQIITLRMIEALEDAVADGSVQALVPQQLIASLVRDASIQMQAWLENPQPPATSLGAGADNHENEGTPETGGAGEEADAS